VYIGKGDPAALEAIQGVGIAAQSFDDLLASGAGEEVTPVPPKPDDVCCIMYTRCVCW
jgi:long-chain acyl-CoA synthetase